LKSPVHFASHQSESIKPSVASVGITKIKQQVGVIILDKPNRPDKKQGMANALSAPHFSNEDAAFAYVEERLWPAGPVCSHCGEAKRVGRMGGKATRKGLHKCYKCRKQFTVRQGTIFESSHVPLNVWLQAIFLIASSKKGISSNQLHRMLGVTLKTAWFLSHRIREAMRDGDMFPMGGEGGVVEIDETFVGHKKGVARGRGGAHKIPVLSLVHRETGKARSFVVDKASADAVIPIVRANVDRETYVMTDEAPYYTSNLRTGFLGHGSVNHRLGEYGRGRIHTNTIEGFFSIFKRGMRGVYQHCAEKHLHRYLAEFDFRYSNRIAVGCDDHERADRMLRGVVGKRLKYA
jgi:transposase-like protein